MARSVKKIFNCYEILNCEVVNDHLTALTVCKIVNDISSWTMYSEENPDSLTAGQIPTFLIKI